MHHYPLYYTCIGHPLTLPHVDNPLALLCRLLDNLGNSDSAPYTVLVRMTARTLAVLLVVIDSYGFPQSVGTASSTVAASGDLLQPLLTDHPVLTKNCTVSCTSYSLHSPVHIVPLGL